MNGTAKSKVKRNTQQSGTRAETAVVASPSAVDESMTAHAAEPQTAHAAEPQTAVVESDDSHSGE